MRFLPLVFLVVSSLLFSKEVKVLAFSGSTRADSYNQQLAVDAANLAKGLGASVTVINLKNFPMPFYDADLEVKQGMPKQAKAFRQLLLSHDAVIIASPEYNGSLSAVLKNAIDWASRDEQGSFSLKAFEGKRFAIMSASPGRGGGARGLGHLRAILEGIGAVVVPTQVTIPQAHLHFKEKERAENGLLKTEIEELLQ